MGTHIETIGPDASTNTAPGLQVHERRELIESSGRLDITPKGEVQGEDQVIEYRQEEDCGHGSEGIQENIKTTHSNVIQIYFIVVSCIYENYKEKWQGPKKRFTWVSDRAVEGS